MSFWRKGKDAAIVGFWGGIGAGLGAVLIGGLRRVVSRPVGMPESNKAYGAQLLEDIQTMPASETESLSRRFQEALRRNEGEKFVALLARIPTRPNQGRQETLRYLNDLSDERFEEMTRLLEYPEPTTAKLAKHVGALADKIDGPRKGKTRG